MPWCPKCKRYQDEDDLCKYCWVETVDQLEKAQEILNTEAVQLMPEEEQGAESSDKDEYNSWRRKKGVTLLYIIFVPSLISLAVYIMFQIFQ